MFNRLIKLLLLTLCVNGHSWAADYFVATDGNDSAEGTLLAPFATIGHAVGVLAAGDTLYIRGGNYHEAVVINGLHGSSSANITFTGYDNEVVILDGSVPVESLEAAGSPGWVQHSGDIYKITLDSDISQVFVNGQWNVLARWPNVGTEDDALWDRSRWAQGDESKSVQQHEYDDPSSGNDLAASGINMNGATAILNLGNFLTQAQLVTAHVAGQDNFTYDAPMAILKPVFHYYFFDSKLDLLDSEKEWYFDPATKTLYLWQESGGIPADNSVRVKNITNAFYITNSSYLNFEGLDFFASTFRMDTVNNVTIENSDFKYPVYNKRTLGERGETFGTHINSSSYVKFLNCSFAYTDGLVMKFWRGNHNTVENCEFHHLDYTVAHHSGNSGVIWFKNDEYATFKRNTVYKTGASEGIMPSSHARVELNNLYDMAHLQHDGAYVHLMQPDREVDIINNWFHQSRKPAIRLTDGPKDILPDAPLMRTGRAFNNVVFEQAVETVGMVVKGDEREIYNNSVIRDDYSTQQGIAFVDNSGDQASLIHANSISRNNALSSAVSKQYTSYVQPNGSHESNWEGELLQQKLSPLLRDPNNRDFRPAPGSALIDAGSVVSGITDGFLGTAPDIGAYESGETNYWIPGRKLAKASTPIPKNKGTFVKLDADLMWLDAYKAISHDVYLGTAADKLVHQANQSNNIFSPDNLLKNQTYYWRVDANTPSGTITGDVWSFSTDDPASIVTTIFNPVADAYVDDSAPSVNKGSEAVLLLTTPTAPGGSYEQRFGFLKFDVQVSGTIRSVKLRLYNDSGSANRGVNVHTVTDTNWDELTITWDNQPAMGASIVKQDISASSWGTFDLTDAVTENGLLSLALKRDASDSRRQVVSKEGNFKPELIIEYIQAVANTAPVFTADPFSKANATEGIAYSESVAADASDPEGDAIIFSKVSGPDWLQVATDGTLSGTPAAADVGDNTFIIKAADSEGGAANATLNITVATAPVITQPPVTSKSSSGSTGYPLFFLLFVMCLYRRKV